MRWLWGHQWKQPDKPWCNSELPIHDVDEALFAAATRVTVRNGRMAMFWMTHWIQGNSLASMFPNLFRHSRRKNRSIAEAMSGETWIRDVMHNVTPDILAEYITLWMVIDAISFDPTDPRPDEIIWTRTASGEYTASSAYHMQFQGSVESNFKTLIWQVWAPSRCKFFVWLMLQNRVWRADRLLLHQWPNEYFCPLRVRGLETITQLLRECPLMQSIWARISGWVSLPRLHPQQWNDDSVLATWYGDLSGALPAPKAKGVKSLIILVCWTVWREHNRRIFDRVERNAGQVVAALQSEARQLLFSTSGAPILTLLIIYLPELSWAFEKKILSFH
jgi:hypothetical protein